MIFILKRNFAIVKRFRVLQKVYTLRLLIFPSILFHRGHLEDVNDLCWSHNDENIVSGSVDHTTILWDVLKGVKLAVFSDAKHFIAGVTWDPVGKYVASMSCDR